ncbi:MULTISPECIES: MetQ/NlpA family ABC transporter substrate-binding protein [unclassified Bacillus (in: firmicutes)]|uniref:MetQ/NlpA family ABC transporter substrate-binding protein n=1 Tax=unclassified Bacillus (in: firmicutes) TaxID=185979 RepID=UPI0004E1CF76|nr:MULTISPECIES: MetQ/NlpA family ABC transporter substrate-binding protein [unclassified Bacillus (in: firmicutes)]CAI9392736.1 Methionine-binding lipoprotein MetQ [Bacillus sp. T2.9-1]
MKKLWTLLIALTFILVLSACGSSEDKNESGASNEEKETTKLVVGASNVPHAEILEEAKPILKEKGIDLEIVTFQDYVLPNKALESKELDANYFQHIPYLDQQIKDNGYDFVNAGAIHIEPMAVFSKKYKSLDELPDGATIILSNSVAEHGRVLSLLEKGGLIKLKDGIDKVNATIEDIVENPKNIQLKADYEPSLLPQIFNNNEGDAVVINANYALDVGLNPVEDSIEIEGSESPYANIITVRKGDESKEAIKTLVEVLHSKEIQDFINTEYKGAVVPVSE